MHIKHFCVLYLLAEANCANKIRYEELVGDCYDDNCKNNDNCKKGGQL